MIAAATRSPCAGHVDWLTLTNWLGHADPRTTRALHHRVKRETEDRARQAMIDLRPESNPGVVCAQLARSESEADSAATEVA
jgi:hypothetical protein